MALWDAEIEALRPRINEEVAGLLALFPAPSGEFDEAALDGARALFTPVLSGEGVDRSIPGPGGDIRLRTFTPPGDAQGVMLNIHGGAWVMGAPQMNDLTNALVARELGVAVVSVDYRLAPEHPYPAGHDDCETAAVWVLDHAATEFGSDRLLISGESAGAHLAAATLLRVRDRHQAVDRFRGANLVFGVYDIAPSPSKTGVGAGPDILHPETMGAAIDWFLPGMTADAMRDPDVSPVYADLRGLPPALFTAGTADHLLDDTIMMAARWELAGNRTEMLLYPDAPHGCTFLTAVSEHWTPRMLDFLRACLKD
jgi:acetyl esterase/lipase